MQGGAAARRTPPDPRAAFPPPLPRQKKTFPTFPPWGKPRLFSGSNAHARAEATPLSASPASSGGACALFTLPLPDVLQEGLVPRQLSMVCRRLIGRLPSGVFSASLLPSAQAPTCFRHRASTLRLAASFLSWPREGEAAAALKSARRGWKWRRRRAAAAAPAQCALSLQRPPVQGGGEGGRGGWRRDLRKDPRQIGCPEGPSSLSPLPRLGQAARARPPPPLLLLSAVGGRRLPFSARARWASPFASAAAQPAAFAAATFSSASASSARLSRSFCAAMPEKRPFERLPAEVRPINYGLCLKPDLIDFTFEGKLEAAVEVALGAGEAGESGRGQWRREEGVGGSARRGDPGRRAGVGAGGCGGPRGA